MTTPRPGPRGILCWLFDRLGAASAPYLAFCAFVLLFAGCKTVVGISTHYDASATASVDQVAGPWSALHVPASPNGATYSVYDGVPAEITINNAGDAGPVWSFILSDDAGNTATGSGSGGDLVTLAPQITWVTAGVYTLSWSSDATLTSDQEIEPTIEEPSGSFTVEALDRPISALALDGVAAEDGSPTLVAIGQPVTVHPVCIYTAADTDVGHVVPASLSGDPASVTIEPYDDGVTWSLTPLAPDYTLTADCTLSGWLPDATPSFAGVADWVPAIECSVPSEVRRGSHTTVACSVAPGGETPVRVSAMGAGLSLLDDDVPPGGGFEVPLDPAVARTTNDESFAFTLSSFSASGLPGTLIKQNITVRGPYVAGAAVIPTTSTASARLACDLGIGASVSDPQLWIAVLATDFGGSGDGTWFSIGEPTGEYVDLSYDATTKTVTAIVVARPEGESLRRFEARAVFPADDYAHLVVLRFMPEGLLLEFDGAPVAADVAEHLDASLAELDPTAGATVLEGRNWEFHAFAVVAGPLLPEAEIDIDFCTNAGAMSGGVCWTLDQYAVDSQVSAPEVLDSSSTGTCPVEVTMGTYLVVASEAE